MQRNHSVPDVYDLETVFAIARLANIDESDGAAISKLNEGLNRGALWFRVSQSGRNLVPGKQEIAALAQVSAIALKVKEAAERLHRDDGKGGTSFRGARITYQRQRSKLVDIMSEDGSIDLFLDSKMADALVDRSGDDRAKLGQVLAQLADAGSSYVVVSSAAVDLAKRAKNGLERLNRVRKMTIRPGHSGDVSLNGWIDDMLSLYVDVSGRKAAYSIGAPGRHDEGVANGPLVRFLMEAFKHLDVRCLSAGLTASSFGEDAWASRIKTAQKAKKRAPE